VLHVAFLRAVNVGTRRVAMARVVRLVGELGYLDAWTFVNSGNVVFHATGARARLEHALGGALEKEFGFEVTTFVRTAAELRSATALQPFEVGPGDTYFVTFLKDRPSKAKEEALESLSNDFDTLVVDGRDVHWRMRGRSIDTTAGAKSWDEHVGRHRSTSRNMNMLRRLLDKLDARQ
jgi:uncharacterized protein (DUF1697 family)